MAEFCAVCLRRRTGVGGCACAAGAPPVDALPPLAGPAFQPPYHQQPTAPQPFPTQPAPPAGQLDLRGRTLRRVLIMAAAALVVVGTAVTAAVVATHYGGSTSGDPIAGAAVEDPAVGGGSLDEDSPDGTGGYSGGVPLPTGSTPVSVTGISASCTSGPGEDSAGNPFTYEARNAIDGRPDTAWRCDHDGVGQGLLLTFSGPAEISWAGLVPGFAKTDPYDGTDRYLQGRRVSAARFVFDDGTYVEQTFDTATSSRVMQVVTFPPRRTGHVELIVLASTPGSPTNGQNATDKIAISELAVGK